MQINNMIFGTTPLVVHAPGITRNSKKMFIHEAFNQYWIPIIRAWENEAPGICRKETKDELTIITWRNTETKGCCEISLEKLGLDYLLLGKNIKKWNHINKLTTALEVIDSIKTPYVMALDCFDVIVLRDPYEAVEKFKAMDCDMLFNAEKIFYPDYGLTATGNYSITDEWKHFEASVAQSAWKYLNAGALIVKTKFYKEYLINCLQRYNKINEERDTFPLPQDSLDKNNPDHKVNSSDQLLFHWLYHDFYPRIKIDYQMKIFFDTLDTAFDDKVITVTENTATGYDTTKYRAKHQSIRFSIKLYLAFKKIRIVTIIVKNFLKGTLK
jgi:hypothetical protein